jgi:hypothetical protein
VVGLNVLALTGSENFRMSLFNPIFGTQEVKEGGLKSPLKPEFNSAAAVDIATIAFFLIEVSYTKNDLHDK